MSPKSVAFDVNASEVWRGVLGGVRDVIRQELVHRQLSNHLPQGPLRILDVGCGQGSQAVRLAGNGHHVIGIEPALEMRALFNEARAAQAPEVQERLEIRDAFGEEVADLFSDPDEHFDVVLCHGVIAYLVDADPMLKAMRTVLRPHGILSLLTINGDALAMQPGLTGDWPQALVALEEREHVERLGVPLRAFSRDELCTLLHTHRLTEVDWYGLRVFSDRSSDDQPAEDLADLLLLEERAGCLSPYRDIAAFIHTVASPIDSN